MPRVVHFEIAVDDPERVGRFYTEAFGWTVTRWEGQAPYWLVTTGRDDEPGINGALMHRRADAPAVVNTVDVPSLDDAIGRVEAAGGAVTTAPMEIPDVGRLAYCTDPGGTLFGLFEPLQRG